MLWTVLWKVLLGMCRKLWRRHGERESTRVGGQSRDLLGPCESLNAYPGGGTVRSGQLLVA